VFDVCPSCFGVSGLIFATMGISRYLTVIYLARMHEHAGMRTSQDYLDFIVDMREYDVPYIVRAMIDQGFRVALWYSIKSTQGTVVVEQRKDLIAFPEPRVFAFDIETTKLPLKVRAVAHLQ
jgi:DNA polymerase elongation subunit (family B)